MPNLSKKKLAALLKLRRIGGEARRTEQEFAARQRRAEAYRNEDLARISSPTSTGASRVPAHLRGLPTPAVEVIVRGQLGAIQDATTGKVIEGNRAYRRTLLRGSRPNGAVSGAWRSR